MQKTILTYPLVAVLLLFWAGTGSAFAQLLPNFGEARSGTAAFQFTKIMVDARSAAMGGSSMADAIDASSLYWNPALAAEMERSEFMMGHTSYLVDINMEYLSYVHKVGDFAIGGVLQYLGSGDIEETTELQKLGTGRTFSTAHFSVGISASQKLTELFSYGIKLSYLEEKIEEISIKTGAIDFGFFYRVGDTGMRFAVGINNFGLDGMASGTTMRTTLEGVIEEEASDEDPLPTRFNIAAAYDVLETENSKLVLTTQISNPSDNAERFSVGTEYTYANQFFLRTGYEFGVEERLIPSMGMGIKIPFSEKELFADYAFSLYDRLGAIHRLSIRFGL